MTDSKQTRTLESTGRHWSAVRELRRLEARLLLLLRSILLLWLRSSELLLLLWCTILLLLRRSELLLLRRGIGSSGGVLCELLRGTRHRCGA